ncbi:hypothetical protein F5I97DRAFT_1815071 [Phlebopus sp. FC_14]|nr:hypothetical protein F5I97DRAFT_1815071 [Phlebopus sp. FC_14]
MVRKSTRRVRGRARSSTPVHPLTAVKQSSTAVALSESKRQRNKQGHFRRQRRQLAFAAPRAKRSEWAIIAGDTQRIVLGDGKYVEERSSPSSLFASPIDPVFPSFQHSEVSTLDSTGATIHVIHDIAPQIILSKQGTTFYPHCSPDLANWRVPRQVSPDVRQTNITFARTSTLTAARRLYINSPHFIKQSPHSLATTSIAVLSFASPKRPGGGFLHGDDEQEATIARSTSLITSLRSDQAKEFYRTHRKFLNADGAGLHDHSMVYSPGVVAFRRDDDDNPEVDQAPSRSGSTIRPYLINVLSSVPVNAAAIRQNYLITPSDAHIFEDGIRDKMRDRMARALRIFGIRGDRALVLGAFGCGSSQNHVGMVADLWAELLVCGYREVKEDGKEEIQPAKFKGVFEEIVFAVPGKLYKPFKKAFEMKVFEMELTKAASE